MNATEMTSTAAMVRHGFSIRSPVSLATASVLLLILLYSTNVYHLATHGSPHLKMTERILSNSSPLVAPRKEQKQKRELPKIFHQTYATAKILSTYKPYIAHCLELNPDWQYYLWRDQDIEAFIRDHFPEFMRKYRQFYMYVQRGDSIRYMVLHHYGGIYLDMDVECLRPFFPRLANYTAFVDQEALEHANILYAKDFSAMNSAMGSVRGHPFFRRMVRAMMEVDDKAKGAGPTTGPDLLTRELTGWWQNRAVSDAHPVSMLAPEIFSPLVDTRIHNFRRICAGVRGGRYKVAHSDPSEQHRKRIRELACDKFARANWRRDKSNVDTIGRHLFLHLGYIRRSRFTTRGHFDITEIKRNVKFYSTHRMKP